MSTGQQEIPPTRDKDGVNSLIQEANKRNDPVVLEQLKQIKESDNHSDEMETKTVTQEKESTHQSTSPSTGGPINGLSQKEVDYF